jgi:hypothetical protein
MRMRTPRGRKYRHETAVAVNITLPPVLHTKLGKIVRQFGYTGPSDYFQSRIRLDAGLNLKHEQTPC